MQFGHSIIGDNFFRRSGLLYLLPHLGVMPMKISKFIPGIGRDRTEM